MQPDSDSKCVKPRPMSSRQMVLIDKIWRLPKKSLSSSGAVLLIRLGMFVDNNYTRSELLKDLSRATKLCQDSVVANLNTLERNEFIKRIKQGTRRGLPTTYEINIKNINKLIEKIKKK